MSGRTVNLFGLQQSFDGTSVPMFAASRGAFLLQTPGVYLVCRCDEAYSFADGSTEKWYRCIKEEGQANGVWRYHGDPNGKVPERCYSEHQNSFLFRIHLLTIGEAIDQLCSACVSFRGGGGLSFQIDKLFFLFQSETARRLLSQKERCATTAMLPSTPYRLIGARKVSRILTAWLWRQGILFVTLRMVLSCLRKTGVGQTTSSKEQAWKKRKTIICHNKSRKSHLTMLGTATALSGANPLELVLSSLDCRLCDA